MGIRFGVIWLFAIGCATAPGKNAEPIKTQAQIDREVGIAVSKDFEKNFSIAHDVEVSVFLRSTAERLLSSAQSQEPSSVGVFVIQEKTPTFRNYTVPGIRIYFSKELLKNLRHDNEVAAALAVEISHVRLRHMLKKESKIEFNYTEEDKLASFRSAVRVLYDAGFDPRGVASLLKVYEVHPKESPMSMAMIEKALTVVYSEIARFTPLRNPVVRTDRFLSLQKRISKL